MTIRDLAKQIGCSVRFLELEMNRGRLTGLRFSSRLIRFSESDVAKYIALARKT